MGERKVTDLTVNELIALLATHAQLCRVENPGGFSADLTARRQGFANVLHLALMKATPRTDEGRE